MLQKSAKRIMIIFAVLLYETLTFDQNPSFIIVGGGLAGLATADQLISLGFSSVMIVEGSGRLGGRVNPVPIPNEEGVLELGSEFIKGTDDPLYKIAFDNNLLMPQEQLFEINSKKSFYFSQHRCQMNANIGTGLKDMYVCMKESVYKMCKDFIQTASLAELYQRAYNTCVSDNQDFAAGFKPFFDAYVKNVVRKTTELSAGAVDWKEISAKQVVDADIGTPVENIRLNKNGTRGLLDYFENRLGNRVNILMNSRITKISYKDDTKVDVTLEGGLVLNADHVIVTVSLGVLKKNEDMFDPPLSTEKRNTIRALGFHNIVKFFVIYNQPFWDSSANDMNFLRVDNSPWNCNFRDRFAPESDFAKFVWRVETHPYHSNILQGFITGGLEPAVFEYVKPAVLKQTVTEVFRRYIPVAYNITISFPDKLIRSNWGSDELYHGTKSYNSMACHKINCSRRTLQEPVFIMRNNIQTPVVMFAGEATDSAAFGTMKGAVLSGQREAQRIKEFYQI